ncbi:hypothetical protein FRC06_005304 [Ceratobasidium sp. 370]|nr:hypothetical protein FRC06_005304 [Ceratobasidium sp. 370]
MEDETTTFTLRFPDVHLAHKLNLPKTKVSGNKPRSEKGLEALSQHLTYTLLKLNEAPQAICLRESTSPSEAAASTDIAVSPSYKVLTFEHMHLVPRRSELHPIHSETTTGEADANGLVSMRLPNAM